MAFLQIQWLWFSFFYLISGFSGPSFNVSPDPHPIYLTVTEVNHNATNQTLEISCKIFSDNLEDILKKNFKKAVDLWNPALKAQNDQLINSYVVKNLAVQLDGKTLTLSYLRFEMDEECVYCYFEVTHIPIVKKLNFYNSLLQDFSQKQVNIMHVIVNDHRRSFTLEYPQKQGSVSF